MEIKDVLASALSYAWPLITGIAGFFLLRILNEIDASRKSLITLEKEFAVAKETLVDSKMIVREWALLKNDVSKVVAEIKDAKHKLDDIVILKRDRGSAFSRVDELRKEIEDIENQTVQELHKINARMIKLTNAIEASGINVIFDE